MKRFINLSALKLALVSVVFLASCKTVPLTGRKQLSLVSESEVMTMSLSQYDLFIKSNKISLNKTETDRVRRVGNKIAIAVERYFKEKNLSTYLDGYKWEFNLIDDKTVNAWCMPGGKVVVYTSILPLIRNDAQLATVMSHEIAHAVARHGGERMSEQLVAQGAGIALTVALAQKPKETQQWAMAAFGVGSQVGILLPFSRTHEYEADEMGLYFMAMAGYDPSQSIDFWKAMAAKSQSNTPEFLSTHPLDENRIARINAKLPEAMKYYHPTKSK
ncbi:MAG: M48 family metallopeptidase [Prolixibacteraceae bacterium]|jgi:predicted Zn-dependent protease|nr:M48 family metallopeptidase [Prolixibacteraceae bacterium]